MRSNPAIIHATLAVGASATAPYYDVNITQQLCSAACCDETPVFAPKFSVKSIENVGASQYLINIHVEGTISYMPCGCGCCATRTQMIPQDFAVPAFSATAITGATLTVGASSNAVPKPPCQSCSRTFVSDTPVTITLTT